MYVIYYSHDYTLEKFKEENAAKIDMLENMGGVIYAPNSDANGIQIEKLPMTGESN